MSHHNVRLLLEDVAKSLSDNTQFGYGRRSEFNMIEGKYYPYIWLMPLTAGGRFRGNNNPTKTKTWNIAMLFLDVDRADANEKESERIHDEQDEVVDKYLQRLDDWSQTSQDILGDITIQNDNQTPFYKDDSGIHTGWLVTFQVVVSDNFEYCVDDNIAIYAGQV